mgnify:CR=1 FL=1
MFWSGEAGSAAMLRSLMDREAGAGTKGGPNQGVGCIEVEFDAKRTFNGAGGLVRLVCSIPCSACGACAALMLLVLKDPPCLCRSARRAPPPWGAPEHVSGPLHLGHGRGCDRGGPCRTAVPAVRARLQQGEPQPRRVAWAGAQAHASLAASPCMPPATSCAASSWVIHGGLHSHRTAASPEACSRQSGVNRGTGRKRPAACTPCLARPHAPIGSCAGAPRQQAAGCGGRGGLGLRGGHGGTAPAVLAAHGRGLRPQGTVAGAPEHDLRHSLGQGGGLGAQQQAARLHAVRWRRRAHAGGERAHGPEQARQPRLHQPAGRAWARGAAISRCCRRQRDRKRRAHKHSAPLESRLFPVH